VFVEWRHEVSCVFIERDKNDAAMSWLFCAPQRRWLRFPSEFSGCPKFPATSRQGVITGVLSPILRAYQLRCAEDQAAKSTPTNYCSVLKSPSQHCVASSRVENSEKPPADRYSARLVSVNPVNRFRANATWAHGHLTRPVESRKLHKSCTKTSPQQTDPPRG